MCPPSVVDSGSPHLQFKCPVYLTLISLRGFTFVYLNYLWCNHKMNIEMPDEVMVKYTGAKQLFSPEFQAFGTC